MLMLEQRIQQQFFESADLQYQTAEPLARPLADAAQALLGCLTAGATVLIGGAGATAGLAPYLCSCLVNGFERARPGLAAAALPADALAAHLRAVGQSGDVLWLLGASAGADDDAALRAAIAAAHDKDMAVVALAAPAGDWLHGLAETDVAVAAGAGRTARGVELTLLMAHAVCDALDLQLLGEQDPE